MSHYFSLDHHTILLLATSTYFATLCLGIVAFFTHRRFGKLHHVAYALSCITGTLVLVELWANAHDAIVQTLLFLPTLLTFILMPRTTPYRRNHTFVGCLGLCGYVALWTWYYIALVT
jgi:hypothetical protein